MRTFEAWWEGLTDAEREDARALSVGETMPEWLLLSLTRAGIPQAAAWWPTVEAGPTFTMPRDLVEFIAAQQ